MHNKTQLLAKFSNILYIGFRAAWNFHNFKVVLNPLYRFFSKFTQSCLLSCFVFWSRCIVVFRSTFSETSPSNQSSLHIPNSHFAIYNVSNKPKLEKMFFLLASELKRMTWLDHGSAFLIWKHCWSSGLWCTWAPRQNTSLKSGVYGVYGVSAVFSDR